LEPFYLKQSPIKNPEESYFELGKVRNKKGGALWKGKDGGWEK
jgi:hypothetical protein